MDNHSPAFPFLIHNRVQFHRQYQHVCAFVQYVKSKRTFYDIYMNNMYIAYFVPCRIRIFDVAAYGNDTCTPSNNLHIHVCHRQSILLLSYFPMDSKTTDKKYLEIDKHFSNISNIQQNNNNQILKANCKFQYTWSHINVNTTGKFNTIFSCK